jgi:hypothetical protein
MFWHRAGLVSYVSVLGLLPCAVVGCAWSSEPAVCSNSGDGYHQVLKPDITNIPFVAKPMPRREDCLGCEEIKALITHMKCNRGKQLGNVQETVINCIKTYPCVLSFQYYTDMSLLEAATTFGWTEVQKVICTHVNFKPVLSEMVELVFKTYHCYETEEQETSAQGRAFLFERYPVVFKECQAQIKSQCERQLPFLIRSRYAQDKRMFQELGILLTVDIVKGVFDEWDSYDMGEWIVRHIPPEEFCKHNGKLFRAFDKAHRTYWYDYQTRGCFSNTLVVLEANVPFWSRHYEEAIVRFIILMNNFNYKKMFAGSETMTDRLLNLTYNLVRCNPKIMTLLENRLSSIEQNSRLYKAVVWRQFTM